MMLRTHHEGNAKSSIQRLRLVDNNAEHQTFLLWRMASSFSDLLPKTRTCSI